jgi:hypothetical protein
MALKCVTCGLLFRNRNELDWHIRQEHCNSGYRRQGPADAARGYAQGPEMSGMCQQRLSGPKHRHQREPRASDRWWLALSWRSLKCPSLRP